MLKDLMFVATLALTTATAWWNLYARPHTEFLEQVTACMKDGSQAEYARCVVLVSDSRTPMRPR